MTDPGRIWIEHFGLTREDIAFLRSLYDRDVADDEWVQFPSGWWLNGEELRRRRSGRYRWLAWRKKP